MTSALEIAQSKNVTPCKELKAQEELLHTSQNRRTGRQVELKANFVLSMGEVLNSTRHSWILFLTVRRSTIVLNTRTSLKVQKHSHFGLYIATNISIRDDSMF
jgi:hypothetical protein